MKKLITALALIAFFASPVLAKTATHHRADSAQGYSMQTAPRYQAQTWGGNALSGGRDPDANIRSELNRDYGQSLGAY
jgi:hypothetical protein